MNDRFRFRVFYKPHNKIYNVICLNSDRQKEIIIEYKGSTALVEWENCDILQCTGLKDKNGKLIYEGDIVKNNQNSLYSVKFEEFEHQTEFCLKRIENPDYYPHISTWQGIGYKDQKNYEVIGNIYKNKGLLEEE